MLDEPVRGSVPPPAFYSLSGIEQARAFLQASLPATPLARLVGYRPTQLSSGSATVTMPVSPWLQFGNGTVDHGILLSEALALAVLTGAPPAHRIVTAAISVSHFRPTTLESGSLVARGRVLNSGSAFTAAEVLMEDALGRGVAQATASLLLRPIDPPPPPHEGFAPVDEPRYATPDPHSRPLPHEDFRLEDGPALDGLRKLVRNEMPRPPIARLLGVRYLEAGDDGSGALSMPASPWLCSRWRELDPGPIGTVMHLGMSAAPLTFAKANQYLAALSQHLTFLRSVPADDRELLFRYHLAHRGDDLLVSAVEVLDADGSRVAMGSQTSVLRDRQRRGAPEARRERILATVLFTDIVGSTRRARELGDERWRELLTEHDAVVRRQLATFQGREIKSIGDGFLAAFESPARAVECARAIRDNLRPLGIEIRAGIHTGECERVGSDLAGIAVHAASRIESAAAPGEILVSSTVHDLVAGSGLPFADRGLHELKDIGGQRQLFAVAD